MKTQVSIIIPTLNRADYLIDTLISVLNQSFPYEDYEIIIADNGSADNTKDVSEQVIASHLSHQLRYVWEPEPGLLSGRHRGAQEANGEILVFIDDDIEADKDWLASIMNAFEDPSVHLVGGRNLPKYESAPPKWIEGFWEKHEYGRWCGWLSLLDFGDKIREIDPTFIWGLNFAIRKKTLFQLGGFNPDIVPKELQRFQGDGETGLSLKIKEKGLKAIYCPKALVWHNVPNSRMTLKYFEKRAYYQGVCDSYTKIRSSHKLNLKIKEDPFFAKKIWRFFYWNSRFVIKKIKDIRDPYSDIKGQVATAQQAGFKFHQDEVARDPELLEWVLKENYFDYKLP